MTPHTIDVGDDLAPLRITLTGDTIRGYCAAARMAGGRFESDEGGRQEGLPGQIAPGNMSLALFSALLARALPGTKLLRLSGTFRALVRPDVALIARGVVTERHAHVDGDRLECDLVLETDAGDRLVTGTASLLL